MHHLAVHAVLGNIAAMLVSASVVEGLRDTLNFKHESSHGNTHVKPGTVLNISLKQGLMEKTFKPARVCGDANTAYW